MKQREKKYQKALVQLRQDKDYYLTRGKPQMLKIKSETLNNISNYVKGLLTEIEVLKKEVIHEKSAFNNLKYNTQLLVTYCELRGLNPDYVFNVFQYGNSDSLECLNQLIKTTDKRDFTDGQLNRCISFSVFSDHIDKQLLDFLSKLTPNTPEAEALVNEIKSYSSQNIYELIKR